MNRARRSGHTAAVAVGLAVAIATASAVRTAHAQEDQQEDHESAPVDPTESRPPGEPAPPVIAVPVPRADETKAVATVDLIAAVPPAPSGQPDARAVWAPVAGAFTALVPLIVGGSLIAHDNRQDLQRAGTTVVLSGFAAAPWVSHAIAGRWKRAWVFGLASLGLSAATFAATRIQDPFDPYIANRKRLAFGTLLAASLFAAGIGVTDSFIVEPETGTSR
jgi:hypothetical protein